jgi:hypothetical protein
MADLFVVMSAEELDVAIDSAIEKGIASASVYRNISYRLIINEEDAIKYCHIEGAWFPYFSDYILFNTLDKDSVALLLSPTIWNNYNINKLYKKLNDEKIEYKDIVSPYYNIKEAEEFKLEEKEFSTLNPINSPWTARDYEIVEDAFNNIDGINNVTLLEQANIRIVIFIDFMSGRPMATRIPLEFFNYPNLLSLQTDYGKFNIFMGDNVELNDVEKLIYEKGYSFTKRKYTSDMASIVLYEDRGRRK